MKTKKNKAVMGVNPQRAGLTRTQHTQPFPLVREDTTYANPHFHELAPPETLSPLVHPEMEMLGKKIGTVHLGKGNEGLNWELHGKAQAHYHQVLHTKEEKESLNS